MGHVPKPHLGQHHGQMTWTGEFDIDGYGILACDVCPYRIGLKPGADSVYKLIERGWVAGHNAVTTPEMVEAALALGVWDHLKEEKPPG